MCLKHARSTKFDSKVPEHVRLCSYRRKVFLCNQNENEILPHANQPEPQRTCKIKRFITKIIFLTAVARPRFDYSRNRFFDGKIGIWPFAVQEEAHRTSKNRTKGTQVTKIVLWISKCIEAI